MRSSLLLSLFCLSSGCGGGGAGHSDAPPDAGPGPVALTVLHNGAPVAGVHVYFVTADGSPVATLDTDASGGATAMMVAGGSVTALDPFGPSQDAMPIDDLRTFAGVVPGDHLVLTLNDQTSVTDVTLTVPMVDQANAYKVFTTCGNGQIEVEAEARASIANTNLSGSLALQDCSGTVDILVIATRAAVELGSPSSVLGALFHPGVAVSNGATIDLSADSYQPPANVEFDYTDVPSGASVVAALYTLVTAHLPFEAQAGDAAINGMAGMITLSEPVIPGATRIVDSELQLGASHHVIEAGPVTASYQLDLGGMLLPDVMDGPAYDADTRRLSWDEVPGGAMPDATFTSIDVIRDPTASQPTRRWHWSIAAPYTPGEVQFPVLPTDVDQWAPPAGQAFIKSSALAYARLPGGYDAVREHALDDAVPASLLAPAAGRVVLMEFFAEINAVEPNPHLPRKL